MADPRDPGPPTFTGSIILLVGVVLPLLCAVVYAGIAVLASIF